MALPSRPFGPVRMVFEVVRGVEGVASGCLHSRRPPLRRRSLQASAAGLGSQGQPARAERSEPRSGVLDGPEQRSYQENRCPRREHVSHGREPGPARSPMPERRSHTPAARHEPPSTSPGEPAQGPPDSPTIAPGEPHLRHSPLDTTPAPLRPLDRQPRHQLRQLKQPGNIKCGPPGREDHERIRRDHIRPFRRQHDHLAAAVKEVDAIRPPVPPTLDELELPTRQRMKRMRHPQPRHITQIRATTRRRRVRSNARRSAEQQGQTDRPPRVRVPLRQGRAAALARPPHLGTGHTRPSTRTSVCVTSPTIMPGEPHLGDSDYQRNTARSATRRSLGIGDRCGAGRSGPGAGIHAVSTRGIGRGHRHAYQLTYVARGERIGRSRSTIGP
jgi:hypothetical protein